MLPVGVDVVGVEKLLRGRAVLPGLCRGGRAVGIRPVAVVAVR